MNLSAENEKGQSEGFLEFDLADLGDLQFANFGERIAKLIESPKSQSTHYLVAMLDDFLGAVYALILATHNKPPFKERTGPIEVPVVLKRAKQVAGGKVRMAGAWFAGFHFNSALFRLAATYHRALKVVTGNESNRKIYRDDLLEHAMASYKKWTGANWKHAELDEIYDEVNYLKHEAEGIYQERKVTLEEARLGVEEVLGLLEVWNSQP